MVNNAKKIRKAIQKIVARLQPEELKREITEDAIRYMVEMGIPEETRQIILGRIDMKRLVTCKREYLEEMKSNYLRLLEIADSERISGRDKRHCKKSLN